MKEQNLESKVKELDVCNSKLNADIDLLGKKNQKVLADSNDEIDVRELWRAIWNEKWLVVSVASLFMIFATLYAMYLPDVYKSEVLLAPVSDQSGLKIPGQLGGLAALAGVNFGSLNGSNKSTLALEIIKSREFLGRFIEGQDLYIPIMAAKGWNRVDNSLVIDFDIYDNKTKQWVREVKPPFEPKPSVLEVHEEFLKLINISQDKISGMVRISIEHYSPFLAKTWADELVKAINEEMRQRELLEAQRSIAYLNGRIEQTSLADVRSMLYSLIEEQTKTVMLASVRDEYVFKTVDPAVVAEKKAKPMRVLIVILAFLLGSIIGMMYVLVRHVSGKSN